MITTQRRHRRGSSSNPLHPGRVEVYVILLVRIADKLVNQTLGALSSLSPPPRDPVREGEGIFSAARRTRTRDYTGTRQTIFYYRRDDDTLRYEYLIFVFSKLLL